MLLWRDVSIHESGIKKSNETFPDFHFNIIYKYRTSSDKHPSPHPQRLFNLEALRGSVIRG